MVGHADVALHKDMMAEAFKNAPASINDRLDALAERTGVAEDFDQKGIDVSTVMPIDFGTKQNVKVGGGGYLLQRFPVTLYGPSWLRFLREENIDALVSFLEDNADKISWGK